MKITKEQLTEIVARVLQEVTPSGYENVVKGIKKSVKKGDTPKTYQDKDTGETKETNPWAIAWSQKNKGIKKEESRNYEDVIASRGKYVVEPEFGNTWAVWTPQGQVFEIYKNKDEAERMANVLNGKSNLEETKEEHEAFMARREKAKKFLSKIPIKGDKKEGENKKKEDIKEETCAWDKIQADRKKRFQTQKGINKMKITKEQLTRVIKEVLDEMGGKIQPPWAKGGQAVKGSDVQDRAVKDSTMTRENLMKLVQETVEEVLNEEPLVTRTPSGSPGAEEDFSREQHDATLQEAPIESYPHDGREIEDHSAAPHETVSGLVKEGFKSWLLVSPKKTKKG